MPSRELIPELKLILRPRPELNIVLFGIEEIDRLTRRPHHGLIDQNFDPRFFELIIGFVEVA